MHTKRLEKKHNNNNYYKKNTLTSKQEPNTKQLFGFYLFIYLFIYLIWMYMIISNEKDKEDPSSSQDFPRKNSARCPLLLVLYPRVQSFRAR